MKKKMAKDLSKYLLETELMAEFARILRDTEEGKKLKEVINAVNEKGFKVSFEVERGFVDVKIKEEGARV